MFNCRNNVAHNDFLFKYKIDYTNILSIYNFFTSARKIKSKLGKFFFSSTNTSYKECIFSQRHLSHPTYTMSILSHYSVRRFKNIYSILDFFLFRILYSITIVEANQVVGAMNLSVNQVFNITMKDK